MYMIFLVCILEMVYNYSFNCQPIQFRDVHKNDTRARNGKDQTAWHRMTVYKKNISSKSHGPSILDLNSQTQVFQMLFLDNHHLLTGPGLVSRR